MKLNNLASNMTEIETEDGLTVLFSYKTPVACWRSGTPPLVTDKKWSVTTTRHINKWLAHHGSSLCYKTADKVPQSHLDSLLKVN